jgi:hypothetical protein
VSSLKEEGGGRKGEAGSKLGAVLYVEKRTLVTISKETGLDYLTITGKGENEINFKRHNDTRSQV